METPVREMLASLALVPRGEPRPLGGGDSASVAWLDTQQGPVIIKRDDAERLTGEADGLRALRESATRLVVPEVLGEGEGWLIMEALEQAGAGQRDEAALGDGLRDLHASSGAAHGWHRDNACGLTPQPNQPLTDGRAFQRERRLLPLAQACHDRGLLDGKLRARLEGVARDLDTWLPPSPPSLVHGDLWSGNVLFTARGPAIIDPAVYRHYPEVDLAMLTLFGAPGAAFFSAYWDGREPDDWPRREALFQLYPLLNHLLLFGGAYRRGVERALARVEQPAP